LPDLFYADGLGVGFISSDPEVVQTNGRIWDELRAKALDELTSIDRIDEYIRELP
jgi:hypothetical protein